MSSPAGTRRVAVVCLGLLGALLLGAVAPQPAMAHTRTQETTNVVGRLVAVPDLPGVDWTVHTGGLLVEVVNDGPGVLVVEGYEGEPYLRISSEGVERNRRSPATYLNRERYDTVAVPPVADPRAAPDWVHVDDRPRALWHDHRTHWMSPLPPPPVDAGRLARVLMRARLVGPIGTAGPDAGSLQDWRIPVAYDGSRHEVHGELVWEDPPSATPWLLAAVLLVIPGLAGLRRTSVAGVVRPAALVVGLVAAVNGIHLVDDLAAWPSDPLDELSGLLHTTIFLVSGIGGAVWAWGSASGRVLALGVGAAAVLYHQGVVHLPMLFASQFPTVWPDGLVRLSVALGLVQALVVAVVVLRARRLERGDPAEAPDGARARLLAG